MLRRYVRTIYAVNSWFFPSKALSQNRTEIEENRSLDGKKLYWTLWTFSFVTFKCSAIVVKTIGVLGVRVCVLLFGCVVASPPLFTGFDWQVQVEVFLIRFQSTLVVISGAVAESWRQMVQRGTWPDLAFTSSKFWLLSPPWMLTYLFISSTDPAPENLCADAWRVSQSGIISATPVPLLMPKGFHRAELNSKQTKLGSSVWVPSWSASAPLCPVRHKSKQLHVLCRNSPVHPTPKICYLQ